jgi:hypothetical protein
MATPALSSKGTRRAHAAALASQYPRYQGRILIGQIQ